MALSKIRKELLDESHKFVSYEKYYDFKLLVMKIFSKVSEETIPKYRFDKVKESRDIWEKKYKELNKEARMLRESQKLLKMAWKPK